MDVYILIGNQFEGYTGFVGPFQSRKAAEAFANADDDLMDEHWIVMVLDPANDNTTSP